MSTEIPVIPHAPSRRHKVRVHYEEEVISDDDEYLCELLADCAMSTVKYIYLFTYMQSVMIAVSYTEGTVQYMVSLNLYLILVMISAPSNTPR